MTRPSPVAVRRPERARVWLGGAVIAVVLVLLAWFIWAVAVFLVPAHEPLRTADAVVVLGGASSERLPEAERLVRKELAKTLVVSTTDTRGNVSADRLCGEESDSPRLVCFTPNPLDTRGEAEAVRQLVAKHHWHTVIVVTSKYHVARAGALMNQCAGADVVMDPTTPHWPAWRWAARMVYETFGLADVYLRPEC